MAVQLRPRKTVSLQLHPKQAEVMRHKARFRVIVAGRRWGKTHFSRVALIMRAAGKKRQKVWYVAPTYRMAKQIMYQDLLEALPKRWVKKVNETSLTIWLINGSTISLKGADNPDSMRGVGVHFLVMDEYQDIDPDAWTKVLRPTLADTRGEALFIGTPKAYNGLYDLYALGQRGDEYIDNKGRVRKNDWMSWQFPTYTSPFIPLAELEAAKRDMDEKSYNQEFNASFETMSGRVYYPFDRKIHVKPLAFNPKLPIWIGMDFNVDPMSTVIFQLQPDGTMWAVDEIVRFGSHTEEIAELIDQKYWRYKKQIVIYPDPAGGHRQHARGETDLDILREKGFTKIKYRRKHPLISDRVNSVNRMLRAADGTVKLYVDPKCKHFIEALEQTIYKPGTREVDKDAGVEHSADAGGYCIELEFPLRKIEAYGISI